MNSKTNAQPAPSLRESFDKHVCQTSDAPLGLHIDRADGPWLYTTDGRRYLDFISGIGVASIGHGRKEVYEAICDQASRFLHPMVYGEYILEPQVSFATLLARYLPGEIDNIFFANSGAEAVEGALKTARKYTGRSKIFSFEGCYHGDTFGALSCMSGSLYKAPFEPVLPDVAHLKWNDIEALSSIDTETAAVIIEPIQAEGGIRIPDAEFMHALRERCNKTGALLIYDEVMTGFARTGKIFAAAHWNIVPDIIVLAKALGGGLPLGAFAGNRNLMQVLASDPPLSHVTTFGGHALSCAAGLAAFKLLLEEKLWEKAEKSGAYLLEGLKKLKTDCPGITNVRGKGCLAGIEFESSDLCMRFAADCQDEGIIVGWTLHHSHILRMAPPLILGNEQIDAALQTMKRVLTRSNSQKSNLQ